MCMSKPKMPKAPPPPAPLPMQETRDTEVLNAQQRDRRRARLRGGRQGTLLTMGQSPITSGKSLLGV